MFIEDYEILTRLNYNLGPNVTSYKVQLKLSDGMYHHLHSTLADATTVKKIKNRMGCDHPNLLQFIDFCQDENGSIHFLTEFCIKGNFTNVIETCRKKNKYLREEFLCKILQQLFSTLKTIENFSGNFSLDEIFLDNDFNIKLFNLNLSLPKAQKYKSIKVYQVATLILQLLTQNSNSDKIGHADLNKLENLQYSSNFISFLSAMLKDNSYLYKTIDKIMCNATLLLKASEWKRDKTFFTLRELDPPQISQETDIADQYYQKMKMLRMREIALQVKEEKLNEKEHHLMKMEKKLVQMEKQLKQALFKADIRLKQKALSNNNENIDCSSIVECGGESVIDVITTQKIDMKNIKAPSFMRSKSERRIKFKGHSPLKEINYNHKRKSIRRSVIFSHVATGEPDDAKNDEFRPVSTSSGGSTRTLKPLKKLQSSETVDLDENGCKPIAWTEESKRYAFDMLRIMNGETENKFVKHTVL